MTEPNETQFALDILKESFPGRSDKQVIPLGMVYAGMRWGRDFRFHEVPEKDGEPLLACNNEEEAELYFHWLVEHLLQFTGEPSEKQQQLCTLVKKMLPQDAALMLGMHAALYLLETEAMEIHIQEGHSFDQYFKEWLELATPEEQADIDKKKQQQLYQQVEDELMEWLELAPTVGHMDVPWRAPLSVAVKKEEENRRFDLLNIFYGAFFKYMEGLEEEGAE